MRTHAQRKPLPSSEHSEVEAVAGERSELLARKHGGERLSRREQERLDLLTSRLKQLLPPVSPEELETLVQMAEEAERIRERARERRQQMGLSQPTG